ncbi:MAG: amidohydrolase [Candidatus Aminicenantes bacterium]|nr:amidohydrolase [Candidatus Aminicenantes bacterium]
MRNKFFQSTIFLFFLTIILITFVSVSVSAAASDNKKEQSQSADLVLTGGKIITMDDAKPTAEALAVSQSHIIAIGSSEEIKPYISKETRVIDLKGKTAIPGLIEAHGHFTSLGRAKMELDLTGIKNWDEAVQMVKQAAEKAKPGEWLIGRGWHEEKWDHAPEPNVAGLPLHDLLSKASPQNPVLLTHASGHACLANAKAMELAGIDENTPNPGGGEIVKDKNGKPIGAFRENAQDLLDKALNVSLSKRSPQQAREYLVKSIELADRACLENGVTTFHDAGASFGTIDMYKQLAQADKLGVRLYVMIGEANLELGKRIADYRIIGFGDHHLTVRSIKRLIDGALGSHGAWLLEPYDSLPGSTGLNTEPIDAMKEVARIAIENGFQLCTHAIGDRANRVTLDIYEGAFKTHPDKKDLRWRIEHAQHLQPVDIPRFKNLGVIAAMQGVHAASDGPWVPKRLGEKRSREGAYAWRKLLDAGAMICNGSDVPVEDINPIAGFYASATRKMKNGAVFYGEQRMTRDEALRSYTINGAYAAFEEDVKGSLKPGKLADITVLSKDIMTVPDDEILNTQVLYTIVGGKVLYKK